MGYSGKLWYSATWHFLSQNECFLFYFLFLRLFQVFLLLENDWLSPMYSCFPIHGILFLMACKKKTKKNILSKKNMKPPAADFYPPCSLPQSAMFTTPSTNFAADCHYYLTWLHSIIYSNYFSSSMICYLLPSIIKVFFFAWGLR